MAPAAAAASKTLREPVRLISRLSPPPATIDEGEVDDDVGVLDQRLDRVAVEDVAAPVFGLLPALRAEVEGAPRHADHPLDLGRALQGGDERPADLPGRAGDCDGQHAINSPESAG